MIEQPHWICYIDDIQFLPYTSKIDRVIYICILYFILCSILSSILNIHNNKSIDKPINEEAIYQWWLNCQHTFKCLIKPTVHPGLIYIVLVRGLNLQKHHHCSNRSRSTNMTITRQFLAGAKLTTPTTPGGCQFTSETWSSRHGEASCSIRKYLKGNFVVQKSCRKLSLIAKDQSHE